MSKFSLEQKLIILENELVKIQHEIDVSNIVYDLHEDDTYEDLFRDNIPLLDDKRAGILIAIKSLKNKMLQK
jgi:hypothetical protein